MQDAIEEHIRIAQHIMRETANELESFKTFNEPGRTYLLESPQKQLTDAYQRVTAAKIQYANQNREE